MAKRERFVRYTVEQLNAMESKTDWARVDATTEAEIEAQALEDEGPRPEGWEPEWFSGTIEPNAVLRAYVQECERDKRRAG